MEAVREYILCVSAAALLCAIAGKLPGKDALPGKAIRIVMGLFMLFTLLRPFSDIRLGKSPELFGSFTQSASAAVAEGEEHAYSAISAVIKQQLGAYILDKAAVYDGALSLDIRLSEEMPPKLLGVTLEGDISPYGKRQLTDILTRELGLKAEELTWK